MKSSLCKVLAVMFFVSQTVGGDITNINSMGQGDSNNVRGSKNVQYLFIL